jgi:hypothetical protein
MFIDVDQQISQKANDIKEMFRDNEIKYKHIQTCGALRNSHWQNLDNIKSLFGDFYFCNKNYRKY